MSGTRQFSVLSVSGLVWSLWERGEGHAMLTIVEARLAGEIEQGGDGGPEDVGVEDAGADAAAGECERQVYCRAISALRRH